MAEKIENDAKPVADVLLIGAGIMSATLGLILKELDPNLNIEIYERLDVAAAESSDAWNNAGTGHSAFCELNYTPENEDGSVEIEKAVQIAENFEISKQFWSYLIEKKLLSNPENFINEIPHISFVWGEKNVNFLRNRYEALKRCNLFKEMKFSNIPEEIRNWIPVVMDGRAEGEQVAATRMDLGTDVNFGNLTRDIFNYLKGTPHVSLTFDTEVRKLKKDDDGNWIVKIKNLETGEKEKRVAKFVFIGAGGGSLPLLEKANIKEGSGFGGFPVSGQWLRCTNEDLIAKHHAKVYGKAAVGAPPMSVPHLDTRMINGKQALLFGPYAGFSTKFLKSGSYLDLPKSIQLDNILPMISAGLQNLDLTKYLIEQVRQSPEDRLAALKEYLPMAESKDWELEYAGQRVQVIKKKPGGGGILEFGTEVVSAADGSIAALLGASPGASTTVSIMLDLLKRCFPERLQTEEWQFKLREMIPTYGQDLAKDDNLLSKTRERTTKILKIKL